MDDGAFVGRWLLPDGPATGRVAVDGGRIAGFAPEVLDDDGWWAPGFVDVHVHGGGGGDAMDGADGVRALAAAHLAHGTTALLPTTLTAPWPEVLAGLRGIAAVRHEDALAAASDGPPERRAAVLGAHLEGPFVSPQRLGAQPPFAIDPTPDRVAAVLALGVVRVATLAPELPGAEAAAIAFARAGVRVSLGHTVADADTAERVFGAVRDAGGVVGGTHLYNAMTGMTGRAPGVVGALLGDPTAYAELIVDGHHVAAASVRAAFAAKRARTVLITDAIRAAGTDATSGHVGPARGGDRGGRRPPRRRHPGRERADARRRGPHRRRDGRARRARAARRERGARRLPGARGPRARRAPGARRLRALGRRAEGAVGMAGRGAGGVTARRRGAATRGPRRAAAAANAHAPATGGPAAGRSAAARSGASSATTSASSA